MLEPRFPTLAAALGLLLGGCDGGAAQWLKPGSDDSASAQEYRDCLALARSTVRNDAAIDRDIDAVRGADLQRAGIVRTEGRIQSEHTRDRTDAIIDACMTAKGFRKTAP